MISYLRPISKIVKVVIISVVAVAFLALRVGYAALPADIPTGTPPPTPTEPSTPTDTPEPTYTPTATPVTPTPPTSVPEPTEATPDPGVTLTPDPGVTLTPDPASTPTTPVTLPTTGGGPEDGHPAGLLLVFAGALLIVGVGLMAWRQKRAS